MFGAGAFDPYEDDEEIEYREYICSHCGNSQQSASSLDDILCDNCGMVIHHE